MALDIDRMYCGAVRRGDIFLCGSDGKSAETAVVLQDDVLNERLPTVLAAVVEPWEEGERIFCNEVLLNPEETGFGRAGVCRLYDIRALDRRRMTAKKGELRPGRLAEIYRALDINLGRFRDEE